VAVAHGAAFIDARDEGHGPMAADTPAGRVCRVEVDDHSMTPTAGAVEDEPFFTRSATDYDSVPATNGVRDFGNRAGT